MEQITISSLEQVPGAINRLFHELDSLKQMFAERNTPAPPQQTEDRLLTRAQAKDVLKVSFPTLKTWTNEGKVKAHRIGTRVRYYESDLKKALTAIRPASLNPAA